MRDIIVVAIFALSLLFAFRSPFIGILVYYWISFMNPHRYAWGFAYDLPLAMAAAVVTLFSILLNYNQLHFPKFRETYFFLLFWLFITITTAFSIYPEFAWPQWQTASKILLMVFIPMLIITTRQRLFYFVMAIIVYIGFISVKGAVFGIMSGGQHKVYGPPASYLADNNDVGMAMVLIIPFCFFLKNLINLKWFSYGLIGIGLSSIVTCLLSYSRGALLGLLTIGLFYFANARNKLIVCLMGIVIAGAGFSFLPSKWFNRMETIETYEADRSANQRFNSWIFSYRMAKAHLLGGGFDCFTPEQYLLHAPDPELSSGHTAHSIYFEVMAEHGFGGLVIYLTCLVSILISLNKLNRISRHIPGAEWISYYSRAFKVSIIGFMVVAAFLSEAIFDLFWAIYAAAVCFKAIVSSGNWIEMPVSVNSQRDAIEDQSEISTIKV